MVTLKERCRSCDGSGYYSRGQGDQTACWTCAGKGWVRREMQSPDPKWAREHKKHGAQHAK